MASEVLINAGAAEIRIAVVEEGRLEELVCEPLLGRAGRTHGLVGDIVLGRVLRVLPAMQAAFVDIGLERAGFLGAREAKGLAGCTHDDTAEIGACVREGETVVVQIVKDPIGDKGARLSANLSLPGRLCVLLPGQKGVVLSRRIQDAAERARLMEIGAALASSSSADFVPGAGYIFRTAAVSASRAEIEDDARELARVWSGLLAARKSASPPATLFRDLGAVERAMRDVVRADTARVVIDDAVAFEAARRYCRAHMPEMESRIERFTGPGMLFDLYDLEDDIERLAHPRVALPAGGWITLEVTEALTAIDVNSGSFTASTCLEETALATNLEAAREIGRQVRLRGIGGLIVVDFIHLADAGHVARVIDALAAGLARDNAPTRIAPMSEFGLVEITRKRTGEPLARRMKAPCGQCGGEGRRRRPEAVALDVVRRIERAAAATPGKPIRVRASAAVLAWFECEGEELRDALTRKGAARLRLEEAAGCNPEVFDVETV